MGEHEWSPANVLDVFGDSIARSTLVIANERPVAAKELADELNVSPPTVYRRINALVDANLLKEHQRIDHDGNQCKEYETVLDEVTFTVDDEGYTIDIQVRQDIVDDFESMWSDLEQTSRRTKDSPRTLSESDEWSHDPS